MQSLAVKSRLLEFFLQRGILFSLINTEKVVTSSKQLRKTQVKMKSIDRVPLLSFNIPAII